MSTKVIAKLERVLIASNFPFILETTEYHKGCISIDGGSKTTKKYSLMLKGKRVGSIILYKEATGKIYGNISLEAPIAGIGYVVPVITIKPGGSYYDESKNRWVITKAFIKSVNISNNSGDPEARQINFTELFPATSTQSR